MSAAPMTLDRFRELAAAYGAKLERWPESERASANRLLESSTAALSVLREERALDSELLLAEPAALSSAFERKLAEIPVRHPQAALSPFRRWLWAPLLGWSVAAALGLVLGAGFADADDIPAATATAEVSADEAIDALALGDITEWEEAAE